MEVRAASSDVTENLPSFRMLNVRLRQYGHGARLGSGQPPICVRFRSRAIVIEFRHREQDIPGFRECISQSRQLRTVGQ